ncbi:MAG: hypothetical protein ACPF8V_11055, partial [Luteibaculum sp.]
SAGNLDPVLAGSGNFFFYYKVPVPACPLDSSQVSIRINHQPDAGANGDTVICESGIPLVLKDVLDGNPENGGVWSDLDNTGGIVAGNLFNSFDTPNNPNSQIFRFEYFIKAQTACVDSAAIATLTVSAAPEINISADFPILCKDSTVNLSAILEGNGPFDLEISDGNGNIYPNPSTLPVGFSYNFSQALSQTTTFEVTRLIDNTPLQCEIVKPEAITVEVYEPIVAKLVREDCILNPDGITFLGFTPRIELSGGDGTNYRYDLFVNGSLVKSDVPAPNSTHFLDTLPNGVEYSYRFYDGSNCPDVEAFFERRPRKYCECETFVGLMDIAPLEFCDYETAVTSPPNFSFLEPEDTLYYILHDRAGIVLGNRLDSSATPSFTYKPSLQYNKTYFISAIAGDSLNGGIDPKDTCVSVADGTPIIFRQQPQISFASTGGDICEGDIFPLDFTITGRGPFTLRGNMVNASGTTPFVFNNLGNSGTLNLNPLQNTVYEFTLLSDANKNTCVQALSDNISINVFELPRVQITNPDTVTICEGSIASIQVSIKGGTGPYRLEFLKDGLPFGLPVTTSSNSYVFNVAQQGLYQINTIQDLGANCGGLVLDGTVRLIVKKQPQANAGVSPIEVCGNIAQLEAQPSVGIGRWQVPASGHTFSNFRSAKSFGFVPQPGQYQFVWEEENAPCPISRDTVFATFFRQPKADAGNDTLFCSTQGLLNAQASVLPGEGRSFWIYTGTENIIFTNAQSP